MPHNTLHRTLIIRFSSVGDILLSSLLLRVLRRRFPDIQVDYVVKSEYADLVRYNPNISNIIEFPSGGTFADLHTLRRMIKASNYDLIVDLHDSLRSRYLCLGAQRGVRINKRKLARFLLVNFKINRYAKPAGAPSVARRYLETMREFGVEDDGNGLEMFYPSEAIQLPISLLRDSGVQDHQSLIGICPSARHANKMWLKDRFAETAVTLALEQSSPVALFGAGEAEEARCREIEQMIRSAAPQTTVVNFAGTITLTETAAALDRCSIVITNDSGLMHMAAARKRKVVAIFGPTVKELGFFPYGTNSHVIEHSSLPCRPCTHIGLPRCPQEHFKCMKDIQTSEVVGAARRLLQESVQP